MQTKGLTYDQRRGDEMFPPTAVRTQMRQNARPAIAVSGLVKQFGATRALEGLDLTVRRGEVHGFLGPNGAGKTTTVRVLLGLLRRDGGEVTLLGEDPWRDAVTLHRRLAYVPGEVNLWPNLTGGEVIDLLGRLRGGLDPIRRADLLERFQLDPTKKIRAYSKGNRQKVALVAAFASDVELYLLDEPTSGLDPLMEVVFQERRSRAARRGSHGPPVQPHPRRGGGALRSRHDHPGRPSHRVGNVCRSASPDPHDGRRRDRRTDRHAERAARGARRERRGHACTVRVDSGGAELASSSTSSSSTCDR